MNKRYSLRILPFFLLAIISANAQTSAKNPPSKDVEKWFNKKEWLAGLELKPHKTINKEAFAKQYKANQPLWDKAFAFLKDSNLLTLANKRYPIDGDNVFAIVTENPTKDFDSTQWESHKKYIDLHCVLSGEEKIGIAAVGSLTVTRPYDSTRDIGNYSGKGMVYTALPHDFFIFFPADAHRPGIKSGDKAVDKKIVLKIRYAE